MIFEEIFQKYQRQKKKPARLIQKPSVAPWSSLAQKGMARIKMLALGHYLKCEAHSDLLS